MFSYIQTEKVDLNITSADEGKFGAICLKWKIKCCSILDSIATFHHVPQDALHGNLKINGIDKCSFSWMGNYMYSRMQAICIDFCFSS